MQINNKQDVINWLKRLKDDHPLSVGVCRKVRQSGEVSVYTDQVIKNRYQDMIDYLESDEVTSGRVVDEGDYEIVAECGDDGYIKFKKRKRV